MHTARESKCAPNPQCQPRDYHIASVLDPKLSERFNHFNYNPALLGISACRDIFKAPQLQAKVLSFRLGIPSSGKGTNAKRRQAGQTK